MHFSRENFDQLLDERTACYSKIDQQDVEIRLLKEKLQFLLKKLFGRSSEKLSPDQMELALDELRDLQEELEVAEDQLEELVEKPSLRGKRKPLSERIPDDLPVERVVIVPDEVKENPELYKKIGEETLEELDVTPTRFFKRIIIREKYVKIADRFAPPVVAPAPEKLIPNSYASAGLIEYIILSKYCDHLPLYRQEWIFKYRHGIELSRKTMGNWMYLTANWLTMIYEALRNEIRASGYIQADETFIKYQDPKKDHCPNGYLWAYHSPGIGVLFEWFPSRSAECLDSMLTNYTGLLQTDGYICYTSWLNDEKHAVEKKAIIHANCWAHVRRKFFEAGDSISRKVVKLIAKLYQVETKLRNNPALDRATVRQEQSRPVLGKIKEILDHEQPRQLPQSSLGKAIHYAQERWDALNLYFEHGALEIDNNLVENAIRPTAIGKKNWLFFGSPTSGQTSAIIYSLIETCRKLGINPADYLHDVLAALPTMRQSEASNWTPAQWNAHQKVDEASEILSAPVETV
jgi:transposase